MRGQRSPPYWYLYYLYYYYLRNRNNKNYKVNTYDIRKNSPNYSITDYKNVEKYIQNNFSKINKNMPAFINVYNIYSENKKDQDSSGALLGFIIFIIILLGGLFIIWHYFGNQISNTLNSEFGINISNIYSSINNFWNEITLAYNIINNPEQYAQSISENFTNIS